MSRNMPLFSLAIESLLKISAEDPQIIRKSSSYIKDILRFFLDQEPPTGTPPAWPGEKQTPRTDRVATADRTGVAVTLDGGAGSPLLLLLDRVFRGTYLFWLAQSDPSLWFDGDGSRRETTSTYQELIEPIGHRNLGALLDRLDLLNRGFASGNADKIAEYLDMPDCAQIVNGYLLIADELERSQAYAGREHLVKLDFLFNVINTPALSDIHGTAFIEINRCLSMVFREENSESHNDFVKKVFALLKRGGGRYTYRNTIIACITTIAREVFKQNNHPLVETFVDGAHRLRLRTSEPQGIDG